MSHSDLSCKGLGARARVLRRPARIGSWQFSMPSAQKARPGFQSCTDWAVPAKSALPGWSPGLAPRGWGSGGVRQSEENVTDCNIL